MTDEFAANTLIDVDDVLVSDEELVNGFSATEIFKSTDRQGITFDDLIVLPGSIDFGVHEVDLRTRITKNISIYAPLCSTPMDTVTEHQMAIGMALNGGIGFIHCNQSIIAQVDMVEKVKYYENGFILDAAALPPDALISDLDELQVSRKISGVPVTANGKMGSTLVGLVTRRDVDFIKDRSKKLSDVMTPLSKLVTGKYPLSITEANRILKESKKGYLPIIDEDGNLRALTTRTDLKKNRDYPYSSKDAAGRLMVGAAVRCSARDEPDHERVDALVDAGCDVIVLDARNGDNDVQLEMLRLVKQRYPSLQVIAGNVVRASQAKLLLDAGADGLRVGIGVGSVATTQLVKAVGRAQLSSIYYCSKVANAYGVPVIADGGIKNTGCLIKALCLGASCVMMGSLLAGIDECPGDYYYQDGIRLKRYRGTQSNEGFIDNRGSPESSFVTQSPPSSPRPSSSPRKQRDRGLSSGNLACSTPLASSGGREGVGIWIASGVSGAVVDKGPINRYFPYLCQSIRHGLQDMGVKSMDELWKQLESGELRFELRSTSAQREGGIHDLHSFQQRLYA